MDPLYVGLSIALVFVGTHLGLASAPVRSRLVARFGELGFRGIFFLVAAVSFSVLTVYWADHRLEGGPGLALGTSPVLRWILMTGVVAGVALMVATFARYSGSPYDVERPNASRPARGLERITRHPFFAGLALFAGAHALLATHLISAVLMAALAALSIVGPMHQDAKLARLRGKPFQDYVASTSGIPFAAIVAGRQPFAWREMPWVAIALGLAIAFGLRQVHGEIFAHHGAWVILVAVGGPIVLLVSGLVQHRRARVSRPQGAPSAVRRP